MDWEKVLLVGGQTPGESAKGPSADILVMLRRDEGRPVLLEQAVVLKLTDEQIKRAVTVITVYYWAMNFWTCRAEGHSAFICPYLTVDRRLIFSYQ